MFTGEEKRTYQRRWIARRRGEFFADKVCVKCGSTDRLELDHIDPSTKVANSIWSWSLPRRQAEIAKCQVLCYKHHKEKSKADKWAKAVANLAPHGTRSRYDSVVDPCRCEACCAAHAVEVRRWRVQSGYRLTVRP
jgi:hypothetical protein